MKTKTPEPVKTEQEKSAYQNMIDLLAVFTDATNALKVLEGDANEEYMMWVDEHRNEYTKLQEALTETEKALELIALTHPKWFEKKKSIATPYGTVKTTTSSKLEIANEEATILLLEAEAERNRSFKLDNYVHKEQVLDREALEKMEDSELEKYRIKRVTTTNVNIVPAKVELGKAVKESAEKAAA